jgi:hypothetical protein
MYRTLAAQAGQVYDPSPAGIAGRFGGGLKEIVTFFFPLLGDWLPWWPITVLVVAATLAIPGARRRLLSWWFFWPLLAAPAVFMVAYHLLNPYPLDVRPYRVRFATFFLPSYLLIVVALGAELEKGRQLSAGVRKGLVVLLCAALLSQLPMTARVLFENDAVDFGQAAHVLTTRLPKDAIVLYDTPSPIGRWRQPFLGKPRYMGKKPYVKSVSRVGNHLRKLPRHGPVYVLMLDSRCAYSVVCDVRPAKWDESVPGWAQYRFDRFTLYEPRRPLDGRDGVIETMKAFGEALGPAMGYRETFLAAKLLRNQGRVAEGRTLVQDMYAKASPGVDARIRTIARRRHLNPFLVSLQCRTTRAPVSARCKGPRPGVAALALEVRRGP